MRWLLTVAYGRGCGAYCRRQAACSRRPQALLTIAHGPRPVGYSKERPALDYSVGELTMAASCYRGFSDTVLGSRACFLLSPCALLESQQHEP